MTDTHDPTAARLDALEAQLAELKQSVLILAAALGARRLADEFASKAGAWDTHPRDAMVHACAEQTYAENIHPLLAFLQQQFAGAPDAPQMVLLARATQKLVQAVEAHGQKMVAEARAHHDAVFKKG